MQRVVFGYLLGLNNVKLNFPLVPNYTIGRWRIVKNEQNF